MRQATKKSYRSAGLIAVSLVLLIFACSDSGTADLPLQSFEPGIQREIAYTDKSNAFWVTNIGGYHNSPWHGLTLLKRQYLEDLFIFVEGKLLPRDQAMVSADPVQLKRYYRTLGITETWTLLDNQAGLLLELESNESRNWTIQPAILGGRGEDFGQKTGENVLEITNHRLENVPSSRTKMNIQFSQRVNWDAPRDINHTLYNAFLTASATAEKATKLTILVSLGPEVFPREEFASETGQFLAQRQERIAALLSQSTVVSNNHQRDEAIAWAHASLDALIMDQMGKGIYAGLPWFDDYWGRDVFISFTGAVLVSGKFEVAREILTAFAKFQNKETGSPNYGRVPNRAQPQDIIYNTTDGTPRFVKSVWDYHKYSGDEAFLEKMWPAVRLATEGSMKNWVDEHGLLRHADADTWMDAKGPEGPWSPRGDRAIDIQFLWRDQLKVAHWLATHFGDVDFAATCEMALSKLEQGVELFRMPRSGIYADHLNADGSQDTQLRPNVFLVPPYLGPTCDWKTFRTLAPRLITRHGVLSLAQEDENFHPYHQMPGLYVKDAAYHNGIIWTWNSAAAIDMSLAFNQTHYAEVLFNDLSDQLLRRGAIGTISELTDAWPREGEIGLSGTFSQAWSLAEYLRVFYEDILGVHPLLGTGKVRLAPRLLSDMQEVEFVFPVGQDTWKISYHDRQDVYRVHIKRQTDQVTELEISLPLKNREASIMFPWESKELELQFEKQMGQWTHGDLGGEPRIGFSNLEFPLDSLSFCVIDTSVDIPVFKGPGHRLLSLEDVIPSESSPRRLLLLEDEKGDDVGLSQNLVYPKHSQFVPGIVDILRAEVLETDSAYHFTFDFTELTDPGWHPEYGYQLTYIAMGIDYPGSVGTDQIGKNARDRFKGDFRADEIMYISGGILLVDAQHQPVAEYMPTEARGAIGNASKNQVHFKLPKNVFSNALSTARFQLAVGFQDDHGGAGIGDFRLVEDVATEWSGGGADANSQSAIYDWILE